MLIAALMMVLLLSGCRTRISNNTEVASTISDEDGWLQETYQMRRDDLDMPVAKKPFILGSKDEELDGYDGEYESDYDFDSDFDRETEEEEDVESTDDSSNTSSSTQTTTSSSSTAARRTTSSSTIRRRTTTRRTTPTKKKTTTKTNTSTKKTDPPKEEQQEQQQQEQPKKQYTISFDGNGVEMDGATITVEEGGTYGSLPEPPSRDDATFDGWYTEKEDGTKVKEGDNLSSDGDHTLYAHWTNKDPAEVWGNRFDIAANDQVDKLDCYLPQGDVSAVSKTVEACKGNSVAADGSPKCIIFFAPNEAVTDEEAQTIFDENTAVNPDLEKVIVISDDSIYGNDKQKLLYKLVLLDAMHGSVGQDTLDTAASDLDISEYLIAVYTRP